jgi:hypothetical protein
MWPTWRRPAEHEIETLPAAEAMKPRERDATEQRGKCA